MVKYGEGIWHCIHPAFSPISLRDLDRLGIATLDVCLLHNPEYFLTAAAGSKERTWPPCLVSFTNGWSERLRVFRATSAGRASELVRGFFFVTALPTKADATSHRIGRCTAGS
ncbi:MAG: hypothetical protein U0231_16285 [Nitrospiraceae bacterium]